MSGPEPLAPLAFHCAVRDLVRAREPGLFEWFASTEFGDQAVEAVRFELLRSAYRLPREAHAAAYAAVDAAARALGVTVPVTLYQAQGEMNAALWFVPAEAHIVLMGPLLERLTPGELRALFGHELAHHALFATEAGAHRATRDLVEHSAARHTGFGATAERLRRWTEIYADRGALLACGDERVAVSVLVKAETGIGEVDPVAYVKQAEEVLAGTTKKGSTRPTHPELFQRALALHLHATGAADAEARIVAMIDGTPELEALDLVQRDRLSAATAGVLGRVLETKWFATEANRTLAARYFPEAGALRGDTLPDLAAWGDSVGDYLAYVLLDVATADAALEDVALAHVSEVAEELGVGEALRRVARKELKLTAAAYDDMRKRAGDLVARAATQAAAEDGGS